MIGLLFGDVPELWQRSVSVDSAIADGKNVIVRLQERFPLASITGPEDSEVIVDQQPAIPEGEVLWVLVELSDERGRMHASRPDDNAAGNDFTVSQLNLVLPYLFDGDSQP